MYIPTGLLPYTQVLYLLRTRLFFGCVNPQITALQKSKESCKIQLERRSHYVTMFYAGAGARACNVHFVI